MRTLEVILAAMGLGALILAAGFVYNEVLPVYFSPQKPVLMAQLNGKYDYTNQVGEFHGTKVKSVITDEIVGENVLGATDKKVSKRIEVDLSSQKLYAFEDGKKVAEFVVSTGKWGRTPTGTFHIWTKYLRTKMEGGNKALHTYYYLPNVPYTMFFYNDEIPKSRGYGIHGTYWHANFGETMSHGCVNMRTRDVEKLFYWAEPEIGEASYVNATAENPGTEVVIYGKAP